MRTMNCRFGMVSGESHSILIYVVVNGYVTNELELIDNVLYRLFANKY